MESEEENNNIEIAILVLNCIILVLLVILCGVLLHYYINRKKTLDTTIEEIGKSIQRSSHYNRLRDSGKKLYSGLGPINKMITNYLTK